MNRAAAFIVTISITIFFIAGCEQKATPNSEASLLDLCPKLPKEIREQMPMYTHYIQALPGNELWRKQYDTYLEAKEKFKAKFSEEIKHVENEKNKLYASFHASKIRFHRLLTDDEAWEELLEETKAACWREVMGIDEYKKDKFCNNLKKNPNSSQWDSIYTCTFDRADAHGIEIFKIDAY